MNRIARVFRIFGTALSYLQHGKLAVPLLLYFLLQLSLIAPLRVRAARSRGASGRSSGRAWIPRSSRTIPEHLFFMGGHPREARYSARDIRPRPRAGSDRAARRRGVRSVERIGVRESLARPPDAGTSTSSSRRRSPRPPCSSASGIPWRSSTGSPASRADSGWARARSSASCCRPSSCTRFHSSSSRTLGARCDPAELRFRGTALRRIVSPRARAVPAHHTDAAPEPQLRRRSRSRYRPSSSSTCRSRGRPSSSSRPTSSWEGSRSSSSKHGTQGGNMMTFPGIERIERARRPPRRGSARHRRRARAARRVRPGQATASATPRKRSSSRRES